MRTHDDEKLYLGLRQDVYGLLFALYEDYLERLGNLSDARLETLDETQAGSYMNTLALSELDMTGRMLWDCLRGQVPEGLDVRADKDWNPSGAAEQVRLIFDEDFMALGSEERLAIAQDDDEALLWAVGRMNAEFYEKVFNALLESLVGKRDAEEASRTYHEFLMHWTNVFARP
ncbi:MAG: hypothetical protein SPJ12_05480 [Duodenibacillus sp.]|nr:hypothetical protein [Duodenibacillus sp.]